MRLLRLVFIFSLIPAFSFAQRGGGGHGGGGGHIGGGGGGFHGSSMGGGFSGGARSMGTVSRGFSGNVGAFRGGAVIGGVNRGIGGYSGAFRVGYGYGGRFGYGRSYYIGFGFGWPYWGYGWGYPYWGWPGYYDGYDCTYFDCGGYYGSPYDYGYGYGYDNGGYPPNASNYISQPAPPVVVNQNFASNGGGSGSYYRQPDYYLIAFTDHTIQAVVNYRVEGDQFVFTTRDHVEKRVPLSTVDRQFTAQINRDRRIDFRLPQQ